MITFAVSDRRGTIESMVVTGESLGDMSKFFAALRDPWYDSRRALYDSQGDSADVTWPLYSDTAEQHRYVYVKGELVGMDGPIGDDDVLMWGGPSRLRHATVGESSEAYYGHDDVSARIRIDVPHASRHDRGEGQAPQWAWPGGDQPYTTPQRRLSAMGGGDRQDSFQLMFSALLAQHIGESGERIGLTTDELQAELAAAYAPREGV